MHVIYMMHVTYMMHATYMMLVTLALRRWKQENQKLGAEMAELGEALAITRQPEFHPWNTRGGR